MLGILTPWVCQYSYFFKFYKVNHKQTTLILENADTVIFILLAEHILSSLPFEIKGAVMKPISTELVDCDELAKSIYRLCKEYFKCSNNKYNYKTS